MREKPKKPPALSLVDSTTPPAAQPPELGPLDPPAWMTEQQKAIWNKAVEDAPRGLLRGLDDGVLLAYVIARDGMIEAAKKVNEFGMVVKGPNTGFAVQSPFESIKNKQSEIMTKNASELGFSPVSRGRIEVASEDAKKKTSNAKKYFDN